MNLLQWIGVGALGLISLFIFGGIVGWIQRVGRCPAELEYLRDGYHKHREVIDQKSRDLSGGYDRLAMRVHEIEVRLARRRK